MYNISESRMFCANISLILYKIKSQYLLNLMRYLVSRLFNKFCFSLAFRASMNFEFKVVTFIKWHFNIKNFIKFAMYINQFLITVRCFGLGCCIMSVCEIFVSEWAEWIVSERCSTLICLNEFLLRVDDLGLHWTRSLSLILISDYTEWFTCAWYCSRIVIEFSKLHIALTLHWMISLSVILLSDCEWVLWTWYCSHVALNEFPESDIALRLWMSSLILILLSRCIEWVPWAWYFSHVALNKFSDPGIAFM
jgi:hypothetical protein